MFAIHSNGKSIIAPCLNAHLKHYLGPRVFPVDCVRSVLYVVCGSNDVLHTEAYTECVCALIEIDIVDFLCSTFLAVAFGRCRTVYRLFSTGRNKLLLLFYRKHATVAEYHQRREWGPRVRRWKRQNQQLVTYIDIPRSQYIDIMDWGMHVNRFDSMSATHADFIWKL